MLYPSHAIHPEWKPLVDHALTFIDSSYKEHLFKTDHWLPGPEHLFSSFSIPLSQTKFIMFGESPYPRKQSANGYAFWDEQVDVLWSPTGLSKAVNRATSLRNMIKMLLHARGDLSHDFSQAAIAQLDKSYYVKTAPQLFHRFLKAGFLLLNASLVFEPNLVDYHAKCWRPFIHSLLSQLAEMNLSIKLVLFGRIAKALPETNHFSSLIAEHPYNLSFITNENVLHFFKPLDLLTYE